MLFRSKQLDFKLNKRKSINVMLFSLNLHFLILPECKKLYQFFWKNIFAKLLWELKLGKFLKVIHLLSVEWKEINKCNGYTWNTVGKKIADFALFMERNTWLYCNRDRKDKRRAERARRWSNLLYYLTMGWNSFCSCILSIFF